MVYSSKLIRWLIALTSATDIDMSCVRLIIYFVVEERFSDRPGTVLERPVPLETIINVINFSLPSL